MAHTRIKGIVKWFETTHKINPEQAHQIILLYKTLNDLKLNGPYTKYKKQFDNFSTWFCQNKSEILEELFIFPEKQFVMSKKRQFWVLRMKSQFTWGKYKGKDVKYVIEEDPQYIEWLCKTIPHSLRFSKEVFDYYLTNRKVNLFKIREDNKLPYRNAFVSND